MTSATSSMQTPPTAQRDGVDPEPPAEQFAKAGAFALTDRQKLFWVERKLVPGIPLHHNALILDIRGQLEVPRLEAAYRRMVADLDCLRLFVDESEPVQWVVDAEPPAVEHVDLSDSPDQLAAWMGEHSTHAFKFPGWLFRPSILRLAQDRHVFFLLLHHIGTDGISATRLVDYLADLYEGKQPLPGPSFREYVEFEATYKASPKYRRDAQYWSTKIGKGVPPLRFYGVPRNVQGVALEQVWYDAGAERRARFDEMLDRGSYRLVTPAMSRLAGLATLLFAFMHRVTENRELVIATPVHNRAARFEKTFGLLMEQTFLKVEIDEGETFASLHQKVRRDVLKSFGHAQYCANERGLDFVSLNLLTHRTGKFAGLDCHMRLEAALTLGGSHGIAGAPKGLMGVQIHDAEDAASFVVGFELHAATFPPARRTRLTEHFVRLLDAFLDDPSLAITGVDLLGDVERAELLRCARGPEPATPPSSLLERLEEHCSRRPEQVAVIGPDEQLTYGGLCSKVNRLARRLTELGVGPGRCVAVSLPRGAAELTTLLAVLTAGGAYIPLDPAQPHERLLMIVEDAEPELLVTWRGGPLADASAGWRAVFLEEEVPGLSRFDDKPLHVAVSGDELAYVLFTSGSTGRPKGVEITRRSLDNFLASMEKQPGLSDGDRLLAITTTMFDIAGLELFLPLCVGATVQIADRETAVDSRRLRATLERDPVTVLQATPATWRSLVEIGWPGDRRLRMFCGGEALSRDLADQLLDRGGALWNLYGPTETTVWSTIARVERGGEIVIGNPIDRTQIYVVDSGGHLAPFGVTGELCIGGAGVARGYRGRPDLTEERFVQDRWGGGTDRVYRTGDLARLHDSGTFECLGRIDHQVKIRGYRIELGEIESVLRKVPGVVDAVVVARASSAGDVRLVGYVMGAAETSALYERLRSALPQYMHPSAIARLETFPLNANGKVDRRALPEPPDIQSPEHHRVAPQTPAEIRLCGIWERALGMRGIGVTDSFFDLGGDSLLAVKVFDDIHKAFGVELPLAVLFETPTVESLARRLTEKSAIRDGSAERWNTAVPLQPSGALPPLFCVSGLGEGPMNLRFLAAALGADQPFYALQHRGADGRLRPHRRIEDMALEFLHDVRAIQPRGPYYIAGYSAGGLPAYEMACMLEASGVAVGLVILIDTENPTAPNWSMRERLREHLDKLVQRGPGYLANRAVSRVVRRVKEGDRRVRAKLAERFPFPFRLEALFEAGQEAANHFHPRPYGGRVVLLQADWRLTAGEGIGYKPHQANGWLDYVRGPLEVTHIPCSQMDIVSERGAPRAAKVAERALAIAYKAAEASSRPSAAPPPSSQEGKDRTAGSRPAAAQLRSVVTIQKGANLLPFFCVHGAHGNVLAFRDLSRAMPPEQPFYGIQAHGVDGTTKPQETIEEMAEAYLAEVREIQPHGPYLLGGYSGGGVIAFDIARRLTEAGEPVALLAFIDTPNPLMQVRRITPMARIMGDGFRARFNRATAGGLPYLIDALKRKRDEARELARVARDEREIDDLRAQGQVLPLALRSEELRRNFERAFVLYRPQRWSGKSVLFRARDVDFLFAEGGPCYGWDEIIEGGVEVVQVPGNHHTILHGANAEVLVQSLGRAIQEIQSSFAPTRRVS